jgi:hypothetical protein
VLIILSACSQQTHTLGYHHYACHATASMFSGYWLERLIMKFSILKFNFKVDTCIEYQGIIEFQVQL